MINKFLFFIFLFFLPTQLGKYFFFPFSYIFGVRVDFLAPTIYLTDIIILFITIFNLKIVIKFFKNRIIIIGLSLLFLNALFSHLPIISFYRVIKIIEFLIVLSLAKKMISTLNEKFILTTLLASGLFQLFLSLIQLGNKHSIQGIFYYFGERLLSLSAPGVAKASINGVEFLRPYGTFSHPNSLAGFFLLLYFFVLTHKKFNNYLVFKYLLLLVSSIIIFISFSKIAIITYLILNTLHLILNTKLNCRLCKIARISTMIVMSLIFLSAVTDPLTIDKRIELMKNSIDIVLHYPIFGVGLGSYLIEQAKYSSKYYLFFNQPVHNIFLLYFSELGLVIGGLIIITFLTPIKKMMKVGFYIILTLVLTGLFDHYWITLQQNFLLAGVIIGVNLSRS